MSFLHRKLIRPGLMSSLLGLLFLFAACSTNPGSLSSHLTQTNRPGNSHQLSLHLKEFSLPPPQGGRPPSPFGITIGPDGALWFTDQDNNMVGRLTPDGVTTEFPLQTPSSGPFGITKGPDGALWFTEATSNKIGRLSPDSQFTAIAEVPLTVSGFPKTITTGPNHTLWFIEGNTIRRINNDNPNNDYQKTITVFDLQQINPDGRIFGITRGPDGAMWFTALGSDGKAQIGRIPSNARDSGSITTDTLTPNSNPFGITAGPDGALWFTNNHSTFDPNMPDKIGRIDPSTHHIDEFSLTGHVLARIIIAGPNHKVWFTEENGPTGRGGIGVIDTETHQVTEFNLLTLTPTAFRPFDLTVDTHGNLWFAEPDSAKIGRITVAD